MASLEDLLFLAACDSSFEDLLLLKLLCDTSDSSDSSDISDISDDEEDIIVEKPQKSKNSSELPGHIHKKIKPNEEVLQQQELIKANKMKQEKDELCRQVLIMKNNSTKQIFNKNINTSNKTNKTKK